MPDQLAQMGDIKTNSQKLAKALEFAKKNPDSPDSIELRRRLERGMFNAELKALGKTPFPVQQPKIDLKAAMAPAAVAAPMSTNPEAPKPGRFMETLGDVKETLGGVGDQIVEGAKDMASIATNDQMNLAQKFAAGAGRTAAGAAGIIGELTIGAGKALLPQEGEDMVKSLTDKVATAVSETEAAKNAVDWYQNLSPDNKVIVDSLGGIAALITEVVGIKGAMVAKNVVKESAQASAPAIMEGFDTAVDLTQAGARKIDDIFTTSDATLEKRIQEQFQKGVKPTIRGKENLGQVEKYKSNALTAVDVITKNKNDLKFTDDVGEIVTGRTPESLKEFSEAITQTKEKVFKEYDALAKSAGEKGLEIDVAKLSNELDTVINDKALQLSNPEAVKYAQAVKERFGNAGPLTAEEAQNVIKNYNNSLQAFYRNPTPDGLTRNAVDALMVNQVRKSLDEGIEGLTGEQYQVLKNQYGALRSIEKDVLNATLRDARKNTAGLIDFTDIFTGGQLITSLASGNVAGVAGAATQSGIKSYLKYLNNPNNVVKKMFKTAESLNARSAFPTKMGPFETSVTEPAIGLSIRSTVQPDKVAKQITNQEFNIMVDAIDDISLARTNPDFNDMLAKYGLNKAQDEELVRFLKDVTDEADIGARSGNSIADQLAEIRKKKADGTANYQEQRLLNLLDKEKSSFNQGATPQTTALLEEAKKYKSAEEFKKQMVKNTYKNKYSPEKLMPTEIGSLSEMNIRAMLDTNGVTPLVTVDKLELGDMLDVVPRSVKIKRFNSPNDAVVDVFRVVPDNGEINAGDYVFVSRKDAEAFMEKYGSKRGQTKIVEKELPFSELVAIKSSGQYAKGELIYAPKDLQNTLEKIWEQANQ